MEVDLELSVGGSFRNLETSKPKIDSDLELGSSSRSEEAMTRREIQARRRQEAKKKREEKKKGTKNGGAGEGDDVEKRMRLEAQQSQRRAEDRERRENEEAADLTHQKSSIGHRNHGMVEGSIQMMVPIQYAYPPGVQYVPLAFPCLVPYWTAAATGLQPVKPIPARQAGGGISVLSEGWTNSSASASPQDGDPQSSDAQGQCSERSVSVSSSYQKEAHGEKSTSCGEKLEKEQTTTSSSISSTPKKAGERKPKPRKENEKEKEKENENGKKKQQQEEEEGEEGATNTLEQMPCVSTTGNGPNGKTITGLLYRYTKTEVSIVCVCHGSSFTPAGFVEHAGGVAVSHPLRHITVIPSAFASS